MTEKKDKGYLPFLDLVKRRHSTRRFRPDPIPEGSIEKILETARWAMSGANAQPWEFIVVKNPETIKRLFKEYGETISGYNFWLARMRRHEYRHPAFQLEGEPEQQLEEILARPGWEEAPALIVVLGDGRRQLASVSGAHTPGRGQTHLSDGLSNASQIIHLAATSLGLASQWVTIHIQEPFKRILKVPDILTLHNIIPIGYPAKAPRAGFRRKLKEMVHYEVYDQAKYMNDRETVDYIEGLRKRTKGAYARSRGEK